MMSPRALLLVALSVLSCRTESRDGSSSSSRDSRGAEPVLIGTVRLAEGVTLEPTRIENTTDPEICGEGQTLEDIVVSSERGIQNVIVSVRDAPAPTDMHAPGALVLDNVGCRFEPHAAVIIAGTTIEARNGDTVLHTTHLYGPREMNFSLPIRGAAASRVLDEVGIYSVKCDVHGWMQAYIRVDDHPFHAVTGAAGEFRITGLPEGSYTLELWHERLGALERRVDVAGDESIVEIVYSP